MSNVLTLRDHVCNYISNKIQTGELKPHQKINEVEICEDLDISRTPAREALIILAADNLIEYSPRKGFFAKEVTLEDKLQNYAVIGNLDSYAATLALEYLTEKDILKMKEIIDNIDVAIKFKNFTAYSKLQYDFHDIYVKKSANKPLIRILHSLENSFIPITYLDSDDEIFYKALTELNNEHKHIVELIEKKDADELEKYIKNVHWQTKYLQMI